MGVDVHFKRVIRIGLRHQSILAFLLGARQFFTQTLHFVSHGHQFGAIGRHKVFLTQVLGRNLNGFGLGFFAFTDTGLVIEKPRNRRTQSEKTDHNPDQEPNLFLFDGVI